MKPSPRIVKIAAITLGAGALLVLLVSGITWLWVCHGNSCPSLAGLEKYQPRQTSRLYAADGRLIAAIGTERRTLAKLDQIPKQVQDAFVIVEDKRFYSHGGIDFTRIFGAAFRH